MPVFTMKFRLPEEREELTHAERGADYHLALWEIAQEVFRPARKHGYPDVRIQSLIERLDTLAGENQEGATELVSLLEQEFYRILSEKGIEV